MLTRDTQQRLDKLCYQGILYGLQQIDPLLLHSEIIDRSTQPAKKAVLKLLHVLTDLVIAASNLFHLHEKAATDLIV